MKIEEKELSVLIHLGKRSLAFKIQLKNSGMEGRTLSRI